MRLKGFSQIYFLFLRGLIYYYYMLHYEMSGNGDIPLLLLHGFMEDSSIWKDMEDSLSNKFKIIKIDLPGHGKSGPIAEVQTMEEMAGAVKEVVDALRLPKINILGHSMGGYVSLAFAEQFPEYLASLTLFFSSALEDDEEKKQIRRRSIDIIDKAYSMFVNNSIPTLFSPNERISLEDKINLAKEIALSTDKEGVKASQLGMVERRNRVDVLEKFDGKILIITGKHDGAVKNDIFLNQLPNRENIKIYTLDCGHNGHWEKPIICSAIINTEINF